ncbi:unannotated protein [freshwater metagenome]|uniref:Unannotated protein n=1 Tax=freshwater metagenome TaxID=449393 RepID=A0A6J6K542_9ZZZZ
MMVLPTSVEPVKTTFLTSSWVTNRLPITDPRPGKTWNTPSGTPASRASSPRRIVVNGVHSAGFTMTAFPAASAGAKPQDAMVIGKFQGVIIPTTPSGS